MLPSKGDGFRKSSTHPTAAHPTLMSLPSAWSKPEHIQHHGVALLLELGRVDELGLGGAARPRCDRDVLLAIDLEGHRGRREAGADIDLPHLLERRVIVSCDGAVHECDEDESAAGRKRAAVVGIAERDALLDVTREWIDRGEVALVALGRAVTATSSGEPALILAALGELAVVGDLLAGRHRRNVEEPGLRAVGGRPIVVAAGTVGAKPLHRLRLRG